MLLILSVFATFPQGVISSTSPLPPLPSRTLVILKKYPLYELYVNQDSRAKPGSSGSRPSAASGSRPSAASGSRPSTVSGSRPSAAAAAAGPPPSKHTAQETAPGKTTAVRPLDRKAYNAGRDVITKIQNKIDHDVVAHKAHLKKVGERSRVACGW